MEFSKWVELIATVVAGLCTTIPLVIKLVEYVEKSVKEKNWGNLLNTVLDLMEKAETKFENGADKKEWVISSVESVADTINYNIDITTVGNMIDGLCEMSKVVNADKKEENTEQ